MIIRRGDIYYADLSPVVGSEQGGIRPVLIVQNDVGNKFSPTVIAAAITSQKDKTKLPTHIQLDAQDTGLSKNSIVLLEQVRTLDKKRLKERMGRLDETSMELVNHALSVSFGLNMGESRRKEATHALQRTGRNRQTDGKTGKPMCVRPAADGRRIKRREADKGIGREDR